MTPGSMTAFPQADPPQARPVRRRTGAAFPLLLGAVALLAACGGGDGDGGNVLPPPSPPSGPVAWGPVTALAANATGASAPAAAVDADGLAAVLWAQTGLVTGSGQSPLANPYVAARENDAADWGTVQLVDAITSADAATDQISQLQSAAGLGAVWLRAMTSGERAVSTRRQSNGWAASNVAAPSSGAARGELAFAANEAGVQVAAWSESVGGVRQIVAYWRQDGGDWTPLPAVQQSAAAEGTQPAVAVDPDGRAMFVWRETTGAGSGQLRSRLYDPAVPGFGTQLTVETALTDMRAPRVVAYGANQFLAAWEQANNNQYDLRAKSGNASNWQLSSQVIDRRAESVSGARLIAGSGGTAFVAWQQAEGVFASRWAAATGNWTLPVQVGALAGARELSAGMDGSGDAILVWTQPGSGGVTDLYYATVIGGTPTASDAVLLETDAGAALSPALAVNASGVAAVAWLRQAADQAAPDVVARVAR